MVFLVHKRLCKAWSPGWLLLCVVGCHYTCCQRFSPHMSPAVSVGDKLCTSPDHVPPEAITGALQTDNDLFSLVYRTTSQMNTPRVGSPAARAQVLVDDATTCPTHTGIVTHDYSTEDFLLVSLIMLAFPVVVLTCVLLPSFCNGGDHGCSPWTLLNTVCAWILQFSVMCTVLSKGCGMERLALCLGMHAATHACYAAALCLSRCITLMPQLCTTVMLLGIATMGFSISVAGRTALASYDTSSFYSNHLGAVLLLDILRQPAWFVAGMTNIYTTEAAKQRQPYVA